MALFARRARLRRRRPVRARQQRDTRRSRRNSATGSSWAGLRRVHQFCKVGAHAFIANNAAVTRDVPPYVMAVGQPAKRAQCQRGRTEASRLHAGADPQHPQRVPRAVPVGAQARRCGSPARGAGARAARDPATGRVSCRSRRAVSCVDRGRSMSALAAAGVRAGGRRGVRRQPRARRSLTRAARSAARRSNSFRRRRTAHDRGGLRGLAELGGARSHGSCRDPAHLPRLLGLRRDLVCADCSRARPDAFVGIDAPEFNLGVAAQLKAQGIPTVQYVSPQVWAWRQGRVRTIGRGGRPRAVPAAVRDAASTSEHGVRAVFVGHPLADQIPIVSDAGPGARRARPARRRAVRRRAPRQPQRRKSASLARRLPRRSRGSQRGDPNLAFVAAMANAQARAAFERRPRALRARGCQVHLVDGRAQEVDGGQRRGAGRFRHGDARMRARQATDGGRLSLAPLTSWLLREFGLVKTRAFLAAKPARGSGPGARVLPGAGTAGHARTRRAGAARARRTAAELTAAFAEIHERLRRDASARAADAILELLASRGQRRGGTRARIRFRCTSICADGLTAGVDEAGRGPLAGPVVAAAVILDPATVQIRGSRIRSC